MENTVNVKIEAQNGELVLRQGKATELFQYKGFTYNLTTAQSFVDLVSEKTDEDHAIIFHNDSGFKAIIDDTVTDRPQDKAIYNFAWSVQAKEWLDILKGSVLFDIKSLVDFLKRREKGEIAEYDKLLYAVQNFKYVTKIDGDFTYADGQNYTFNIKKSDAETTVRVPKVITANIELFKGSGFRQDIEIEIEIGHPTDETKKPGFDLSCPKFDRYLEHAKEREFKTVEGQLEDYLIVNGDF
jgi:hypothetical protein